MSTSDEPLDVGVVGAGRIASSTHLPVLANVDWARVAYVADVDRSRVRRRSRSYRTRGVVLDGDPGRLPACDVALLATPVGAREAYVETFGERSTPVLVEKPFAATPEAHAAYLRRLDDVSCNYLRLTFGATRQLKALVASGAFGPVESVAISEGGVAGATGRSAADYRTDDARGGVLLERGPHALSQLLSVLDADGLTAERAELVDDDGYEVDVRADLAVDRAGRSIPVSFELTRIRSVSGEFRVEFENATAVADVEAPDATVTVRAGGESFDLAPPDRWADTFAQAAYLRWRQFRSTLSGEGDYRQEIATAPEVTDLIDAVYDRAEVSEL